MKIINHRKLFPDSEYNVTDPCPDICASTCPYGCDPFVDIYSPSPPPPENSLPAVSSKHGGHVSPLVIVIVTLLASCFVVITLYLIAVRFQWRWNFLRPRRGRQQPQASTEEFLDENQGPTGIDYPIWHINTVGLQPSVIDSITIFRYKKGESLIDGTECSVCLNEFRNDDSLRLLPKCSHAFHIPCIDTWLRSHINCPVCRAGIVSSVALSVPVASNSLNSNNSRPNEDFQAENQGSGEALNINQDQAGENDGFPVNATETEEITEVQQVDDQERKMEVGNYKEEESVRRAVSVDSLFSPNVTVSLSECEEDGDSSKNVC